MPIAALVDSLDDVDEDIRSLYSEVDGRFVLDVEGKLPGMISEGDIETHEKTQGLVSALAKEREQRREYERENKDLKGKTSNYTDDDFKELEELRDVKRKAEEERRRQSGEFDKWRAEINDAHTETLAGRETFIQGLQDQIRSDRVGRQIAEACDEHGAPLTLMGAYVEKHVKSEFDEDGNLTVSVRDSDGSQMIDSEGKPLSISGFVKKLGDSKDFGQYFTSKQKAGSGTPPGDKDGPKGDKDTNSGEKPKEVDTSKMSATELATHNRKQSIATYREAQAKAATADE